MKSMKKLMKLVVFMLVITLFTTSVPIQAEAASVTYLEITRDNAPLRKKPNNKGKIVARCEEGAVLKSTGSLYNIKLNKWYEVEYDGEIYYMYSGNTEKHKHDYEKLTYGGATYKYCDCGQVNVVSTTTIKTSNANVIAAYATTAGSIAVADGPIPVGDIIGGALLIYGACYLAVSDIPEEVVEMVSEIDLAEFLDARDNVCSLDTFRRVSRAGETLTYEDNECLDTIQAYFHVLYKGDVYNVSKEEAEKLAMLYGEYFQDCDLRADYWEHYHFGKDQKHKIGGHIFYGTNGYGQYPNAA